MRFVRDRLTLLEPDSAWTMIITRPLSKSEVYSAHIVTEGSLGDIEPLMEKYSLGQPQTTSQVPTQDGLSL